MGPEESLIMTYDHVIHSSSQQVLIKDQLATVDPWTTWVWIVLWAHWLGIFFQEICTTAARHDRVESANVELRVGRAGCQVIGRFSIARTQLLQSLHCSRVSWMGAGTMCLVTQLCPTLCDPMDCSPPGSSVHGILQARILEWVAISFSRGSSPPRDQTQVSCVSCIEGGFFTTEPLGKQQSIKQEKKKKAPISPSWHSCQAVSLYTAVRIFPGFIARSGIAVGGSVCNTWTRPTIYKFSCNVSSTNIYSPKWHYKDSWWCTSMFVSISYEILLIWWVWNDTLF